MKIKNINFKTGVKAVSALALTLAAFIPVANSYAWGPERPTFTNKVPSDHVTFNSITDNAAIKDERDFVRVSEVTDGTHFRWTNELAITPGKTYAVMVYYHNNAASNLNASGKGMATNARVKSSFPTTVNKSNKGKIYAEITADNASPKAVWDEAYFTSTSTADVVMRYVTASAVLYNQGEANGTKLSDKDLFSSNGILLGYNKLIGNLPGCAEYSGQVVYYLRAEQVGSTVQKTASLDGKNFTENVTAKPGDTITYRVEFKNSGTADLTNVTFHDKLPAGVTLVPGTTKLINAANPNGVTMVDLIGQNGFKTGTYGPGATAVLTYQVKVNSDIVANLACGEHKYSNTIFVDHDASEVYDSSSFVVNKACAPGEEPQPDPTPDDPKPTPTPEDPSELPKTGPAEIMLAIVAIVCIATGVAYWYHSQQEVAKVSAKITGKSTKSDKPDKKSE